MELARLRIFVSGGEDEVQLEMGYKSGISVSVWVIFQLLEDHYTALSLNTVFYLIDSKFSKINN